MYKITINYKGKSINVYRSTREQALRVADELAFIHFPEDVARLAIIIACNSNKLTVMRNVTIKL